MIAIHSNRYQQQIADALNHCLVETLSNDDSPLALLPCYRGKVRDVYELADQLIIITSDRHTSFDRQIATIPFKGQVLNQCSHWWFEQSRQIVDNHMLALPDPNVMVVKKCRPLPIEVVVRGYITGTTSTSLWQHYKNGVRNYCGNVLPQGLVKNQKLEQNIVTPTTKEAVHDRPISPAEIVAEGWVSADIWQQVSDRALALFNWGQEVAAAHGLILVDTKYEFGLDNNNNVILIDELHTPDSSRYWLAQSYEERFVAAEEPDNIDKEFLRLWFAEHCDPYHDVELPAAPQALVIELASRYINLYERITGKTFQIFSNQEKTVTQRIVDNLVAQDIISA